MQYADKRVLIVEDQRPFLLMLKGLLTSMGCNEVVTKSSAEQALTLCRKQTFDIVIADLHLEAERKNGFELVEELRLSQLILPSSICILISADSARPVVLGSIERRPDDYLIKPFSQMQLKTRIARAWRKRQALLPVYSAIFDKDVPQAIEAGKQIIDSDHHYRHSAEQLLVELYWQSGADQKALALLAPYEDGPQAQWVTTALARTYLKLGKADLAIELAEQVLSANRFSAEAYSIIAHARQAIDEGQAAIDAINQAIKLSPYSIAHHHSACQLARQNHNYPLAHEACLAIWNLSKRTVHQHISHWCGYIRSMLDVAEYTEDKQQKNRYQQDALLQLQRGRHNEDIARIAGDFDYGIFEQVMLARMATLDNNKMDAKRALFLSQTAIAQQYEAYPWYYAPDSLKVMLDLGEYEQAQPITQLLAAQHDALDDNSAFAVAQAAAKAAGAQQAYTQFNREGIGLYQQGKFAEARTAFTQAQHYAPVNTGVALNLLQCILKLADKQSKPERDLAVECRRLTRLIEEMPIQSQFEQKFMALQTDINRLLEACASKR
ncbi:response regulator [Salinimonas marina]|uniref:Response regulator n=1 Tax=Salinimonas marina TaxID=2785918 RepID=A0A7S9DUS1_9ALTE|nr:response regulator [Salinimonas marina]QPG04302.1 response regulator [Salinimonas marina]